MSGHTVPADFSEHMLDLDEDEDLEVFTKVTPAPRDCASSRCSSLLFPKIHRPHSHIHSSGRGAALRRVFAQAQELKSSSLKHKR